MENAAKRQGASLLMRLSDRASWNADFRVGMPKMFVQLATEAEPGSQLPSRK